MTKDDGKIRVLFTEEQLEKRIAEIASRISGEYADGVHLVGLLVGSVFFVCELAKKLTVPATMDFISCSSYEGTESSGCLDIRKWLDRPVAGRNVILVEDIVDTGFTLSQVMPMIRAEAPADLKLATLLDKPSRRICGEVHPDYSCFEVEDLFVVGFGLDCDQQYRTLPYVGVLENRIHIHK